MRRKKLRIVIPSGARESRSDVISIAQHVSAGFLDVRGRVAEQRHQSNASAAHLPVFGRCGCVVFLLIFIALVASAGGQSSPAPTLQEKLGYAPTAKLLIIHADDLG